jgi:hypothetical protein
VATLISVQLSLLAAVQAASAQSPFAHLPDGPVAGVSLERFRYEDEGGITGVSFHLSRLRHNGGGPELGVTVFPQYLQAPALLMAPDAGVAFNISLPAATLLLRGGVSAFVGLGRGVNVFYPRRASRRRRPRPPRPPPGAPGRPAQAVVCDRRRDRAVLELRSGILDPAPVNPMCRLGHSQGSPD